MHGERPVDVFAGGGMSRLIPLQRRVPRGPDDVQIGGVFID